MVVGVGVVVGRLLTAGSVSTFCGACSSTIAGMHVCVCVCREGCS